MSADEWRARAWAASEGIGELHFGADFGELHFGADFGELRMTYAILDEHGRPTGEWVEIQEGEFLRLEGGTLDLGVIRDSTGWPALRWALARPWRWHRIPRVLRRWRSKPIFSDTFLDGLR